MSDKTAQQQQLDKILAYDDLGFQNLADIGKPTLADMMQRYPDDYKKGKKK